MTNLEKLNEKYVGQKYYRLTVEKVFYSEVKNNGGRRIKALFTCECGNKKEIELHEVRRGKTKSCNCLYGWTERYQQKEHPKEYRAWTDIKTRCFNKDDSSYKHYGARGITMCDEWRDSFKSFLGYVGSKPIGTNGRYSLDRINNDGNYEPGNVRWATDREQSRNTSRNVMIEYNGETLCRKDWAIKMGLFDNIIKGRLKRGWSIEKALTTPAQKKRIQTTSHKKTKKSNSTNSMKPKKIYYPHSGVGTNGCIYKNGFCYKVKGSKLFILMEDDTWEEVCD